MNKEQIIEAIESMTVLELSELVKALEEKFGVSAAAPVAVAAAPAEEAAAISVRAENHGGLRVCLRKRHAHKPHDSMAGDEEPLRGRAG